MPSVDLWPALPVSGGPNTWSPEVAQQIRDFLDQATPVRPPPPTPPASDLAAIWTTPAAPLAFVGSAKTVDLQLVNSLDANTPAKSSVITASVLPTKLPVRETQSGSPLTRRSDWEESMQLWGQTTSRWVQIFQELGPLATSVLLDILSNPLAVAPTRSRDDIFEQMRSELPPRPEVTPPASVPPIKKSRRGRHPISIEDPKWDEIYRAVDLVLLTAQHHRPFSYEPLSGSDGIDTIRVGQALRFRRVGDGLIEAQVADPVAGCWMSALPKGVLGNPNVPRSIAVPDLDSKVSEWSPMSWPVSAINNSSTVERQPFRLVTPLRDILALRQAHLDKDFASNKEIFEASAMDPAHPFFKSASRVTVVLTMKWAAACRKRRANKGPSIKAWWDSFVPRDVLSVLVNVCGSGTMAGFTWVDVAALSLHPDRQAIVERVAALGPEKRALAFFSFDQWSSVSEQELLTRAGVPDDWKAAWAQVKGMPALAASTLIATLGHNQSYRPVDYPPALLKIEILPVAQPPTLPAPLPSKSNKFAKSNKFSVQDSSAFGLTGKSSVGGDWVSSGEFGRRTGCLPYEPAARSRVVRTARALRAEIGDSDLDSLKLVLADLLARPEKMPPRAWEMMMLLPPATWGRVLRSATGVSGEFTADPSLNDDGVERPPEVLARARRLCVESAVRLAVVWPMAFPEAYKRWSSVGYDRSAWESDANQLLTEVAKTIEEQVKLGATLVDTTLIDVFNPGQDNPRFGALMAAHEQLVLKSLLPRRKRGRPRKVPLPDEEPSPHAARRRM